MTIRLKTCLAAAAALAAFSAGAASAVPVTLSYAGSVSGFRQIRIDEAPVAPAAGSMSAGAYYMTDGSNTYVTWDLDITRTAGAAAASSGFSTAPLAAAATLGAASRDRIQAYFDANYRDGLAGFRNGSAAFQAGLWEMLYDDDYSLTADTAATDDFRGKSRKRKVDKRAKKFLDRARHYSGDRKWNLTFLDSRSGSEPDMVMVSEITSVPLPASALLLVGGLAGLGAMARRRRS